MEPPNTLQARLALRRLMEYIAMPCMSRPDLIRDQLAIVVETQPASDEILHGSVTTGAVSGRPAPRFK